MTAETESMILEYLRRMREDMSGMMDDIHVITDRFGHVERAPGNLAMPYASMSTRMDRTNLHIERIERRLDLTEA
jgi:hypothetical protein